MTNTHFFLAAVVPEEYFRIIICIYVVMSAETIKSEF